MDKRPSATGRKSETCAKEPAEMLEPCVSSVLCNLTQKVGGADEPADHEDLYHFNIFG